MRKAPSVVVLGLAVPALSALPVLSPPVAEPKPVSPEVRAVAVEGVDATALRSAAGADSKEASAEAREEVLVPGARGAAPSRPAVLTAAEGTADFELLGVTWRTGTEADLTVVVRTHGEDGWSDWTALDPAPTPDEAEGVVRRAGTEPLWAGPSDGYQVRIDVRTGTLPDDVRVDLIDPGTSDADASVGRSAPMSAASAAVSTPRIYSRAEWGADESLRDGSPNYTSTIKAGFVHHTAGTNGYSAAEVPRILRGIYAYHTKANGWSDVGYNFLVDRFGRIWEGRYGGIDRPVLGAHTGGFNTDTFGVSAIGNYDKAGASSAMTDAIARVLAWKLALHYRDPGGRVTLTSSGGGTSRYPAGKRVTINVVSAHRDMGYTSCPGKNLYAKMPAIRNAVVAYTGAGLVAPAASPHSRPYDGSPITVTAGVLQQQSWRLEVRRACGNSRVRRIGGSAAPGDPLSAAWNLRDGNGDLVRPGRYVLVLTSWSSDSTARSWSTEVTVSAPNASPPAPASSALPGASRYVALRPARLLDTREGGGLPLAAGARTDLKVVGVGGVPSTGVAAVALNLTATCPSKDTYLTLWPAGGERPTVSSLNLVADSTRAALTVSAVGSGGRVSLQNASGSADVVVDVVGYYPTVVAAGAGFHPTAPFRLFDSRLDDRGIIGSGGTRTLTMPEIAGVPAAQMSGAVLNVTAVGSTGRGHVTVYPAGTTLPATSTVNFDGPDAVPNRAVTRLSNGRFSVRNGGVPVHVVVDVVGWYGQDGEPGAAYQGVRPQRVLDTRLGLGAPKARVGSGDQIALSVTGSGKPVPSDASAVVMTLTTTEPTRETYITAWPTGMARPLASDLNVVAGQTAANLVVVPLGSRDRVSLFNNAGRTHLVGDVVGYYR